MPENKKPLKKLIPSSKKRAQKGPNQRLRQRAAVLIIMILVIGFGAALTRLSLLTLVQGRELQERAKDIPEKVGTCIDLSPEKAIKLYELLYELLGKERRTK